MQNPTVSFLYETRLAVGDSIVAFPELQALAPLIGSSDSDSK
uniref:Uncharacterized protein n=1 Tax=Rhizophora mucronata TaxID=61149 RepID=A0A2P2JHS5_RHIMU